MKTFKNLIPISILAVFFLSAVSGGLMAQQKDAKVKVEQKQKVENKDVQQKKVDTLGQQQKKTDVGKEQEKKTDVTEKTDQIDKRVKIEKTEKDTARTIDNEKEIKAQGNAYGRNKDTLKGREFGQQRAADAKANKSGTQGQAKGKNEVKKANKKKNK